MKSFFAIAVLGFFGLLAIAVGQELIVKDSDAKVFDITPVPNKAPDNPFVPLLPRDKLFKTQQAIIDQGCDTNLCFTLQGGNAVTDQDYQDQKNFVDVVINIITTDRRANLAAAQYHTGITPIFELTKNRTRFLRRLANTKRVRGGSNIAEAMFYCLKAARPHDDDANKLILLGNGFSNVGRGHFDLARRFRTNGGAVCAVSVGNASRKNLKKLTNNKNHIVTIDGFFELSEIILGVVDEICELKKNN